MSLQKTNLQLNTSHWYISNLQSRSHKISMVKVKQTVMVKRKDRIISFNEVLSNSPLDKTVYIAVRNFNLFKVIGRSKIMQRKQDAKFSKFRIQKICIYLRECFEFDKYASRHQTIRSKSIPKYISQLA